MSLGNKGLGDTPTPLSKPDMGMPGAPAAPDGSAVDPGLQNSLDQIGKTADSARQMMQNGIMLMVLGAALIAIGAMIWGGAVLVAIGVMIVGLGLSMKMMGAQMANMAKMMGSTLSAQIGNAQQGKVINYCTDQALNNNVKTADCTPPDRITLAEAEAKQQAVDIAHVKAIGQDEPEIQATDGKNSVK
jgi:hypothetical protein